MKKIIILIIAFVHCSLLCQCIEGNCQNDFGTYIYERSNLYDRYEGQWENGQMNGTGKLYFSNGWTFEGEIKNDSISGEGKLESD